MTDELDLKLKMKAEVMRAENRIRSSMIEFLFIAVSLYTAMTIIIMAMFIFDKETPEVWMDQTLVELEQESD